MKAKLPDRDTMYKALVSRDASFEGIFYAGVKTTGIFCRPTCSARKPKPENVEFFAAPKEALIHGYRPCKLCEPMKIRADVPEWIAGILDEVRDDPSLSLKDRDLQARGLDPNRVRRWFKKHHGMTFQSYLRILRIGQAFGQIKYGEKVVDAAFDSGYESLSGFSESFKKTLGFSPGESSEKNIIFVTRIPTPLGPLLAGAMEEGICLLEFIDRRMIETQIGRVKKRFQAELIPGESEHFPLLFRELGEYFKGTLRSFSVPLVMRGTPFQEKVWKALLDIPYGETRSYEEQAVAVGNGKAVRAVARANGDNRIGIIIPCHRVIGKDGSLTGYGGGLERKRYLLDLEAGQQVLGI
jgi:AraC family transcriptional regulator of adaptative response/methylated-DNA-[protein]-cysteine methyltransferase